MTVPITLGGGTGVAGGATEVSPPTPAASDATQDATLNSVSCGADGCEAVGQYVDDSSGSNVTKPMLAVPSAGGAWSAAAVPTTQLTPTPASDIGLNSISCPSSGGACEAVGNYDDSSEDSYPWAVQIDGGTVKAAQNISMPPGNTLEGSMSESFLTGNGVDQVSCPSAGACTAAGSYPNSTSIVGYAVPITDGTPGKMVAVSSPGTGEDSLVDGLSCLDAGDCVLTGLTLTPSGETETFSSFYSTETAGAWAPPTTLGSGELEVLVLSLGCSSGTSCTAYGEATSGPTATSATTFFMNSMTPLSIVTSSLPTATVSVPYSATLQAAGGSGTNNWRVSTGTLPAGLSLNAATGVISGTPTASGDSGFVVTDTDPGPPSQTATGGLSIDVSPAPVSTPTTPGTSTTIVINNPPPATKTTPTATTTAAPVAKLVKVSAKAAKVSVTVSCTKAACKGMLALTTVEHLTGTKVTAITARATPTATVAKAKVKPKTKTKTVTLAKGSYSITAGKSKTVTLTLTAAAAKLLAARHTLPAKLALTPSGSKKASATRKVTLKASTKKEK
jgi:hypothetical protein